MQNSDWISLMKLFPVEQHNKLVLTTRPGIELAIETIIRTEPQYLVFRGRVMGQTDDGRAFFIPYSEIVYVNLNRVVMEPEVHAFYGPGATGMTDTPIPDDHYGDDSAIIPPMPIAAPSKKSSGKIPIIASGIMPKPPMTMPPPVVKPATVGPPAPAPVAQVPPMPTADTTAAKGSILERLRAQRKNTPPNR